MSEPYYHAHPIDEIEPQPLRTDSIAELSERLAFAFAWMLDAKNAASIAIRVHVAAHHFCPSYLKHETLQATGRRFGVTRQAIGKLSSNLRDVLGVRNAHARSNSDRATYKRSQTTKYDKPNSAGNSTRRERNQGAGSAPRSGKQRSASVTNKSGATVLGSWGLTTIAQGSEPGHV
jgi:hypothetical protein